MCVCAHVCVCVCVCACVCFSVCLCGVFICLARERSVSVCTADGGNDLFCLFNIDVSAVSVKPLSPRVCVYHLHLNKYCEKQWSSD